MHAAPRPPTLSRSFFTAWLLATAASLQAAEFTPARQTDSRQHGLLNGNYLVNPGDRVGVSGSQGTLNYLSAFELPATLPAGEVITSANFSFTQTGISAGLAFNVDLYGLSGDAVLNTLASGDPILPSLFYAGPAGSATSGTLLSDDLLMPTSANETKSVGGVGLTAFLNSLYTDGARNTTYVYFRLSPDVMATGSSRGYNIGAGSNVLTFTTELSNIPEPSSFAGFAGAAALLCAATRRRRG